MMGEILRIFLLYPLLVGFQPMRTHRYIVVILCYLLVPYTTASDNISERAAAITKVTYRLSFMREKPTQSYEYQLLELALRKTQKEDGAFFLEPSAPMEVQRALKKSRNNTIENFIFRSNYSTKDNYEGLIYIPISIDLGIFGYRICFTSDDVLKKSPNIRTLKELQSKTMGQPDNWLDHQILKANGFQVYNILQIESMHQMVANNRFDYLCRGANELYHEWKQRLDMKGLTYDKSFAIYYDLPRFFFTHAQNKKLKERVQKGLNTAYHDGSMQKIWREHYGEAIKFSKLKTRRLFYLENPYLNNISPDFQYYFMNPYGLEESQKYKN